MTGMFGGTGNEEFHCFMAGFLTLVCWWDGYLEKCDNLDMSDMSVCRTATVLTEDSIAVLKQERLSWPLGTVPPGLVLRTSVR